MASYIDGHTHLEDPRYEGMLSQVIARSEAVGVRKWLCCGVWPEGWARQRAISDQYGAGVLLCYGVHPWWVARRSQQEVRGALEELRDWVAGARGVGEIGLDFSPRFKDSRERQIEAFRKQLMLARELDLPVVLHLVRAHGEAVRLLQEIGPPRAGGLVHGFSGSAEISKVYLKMGLFISVGGAVTREGYHSLKNALRSVPSEKLVLETDAPDQPPEGWAEQLNEPASLIRIARVVAEKRAKGESAEQLLERSSRALARLFGVEEER